MLPETLRVLYLHGFASSPGSRKARFFVERLSAMGIAVEVPDLAEGDFRHLTITGQLRLLERSLARQPAILIGSSLGGYLAALYAARHTEIVKLVLLAPAFRLYDLWSEELGPDRIAGWKLRGSIPVFHYGIGKDTEIGFQFLEDAQRYESFPNFLQSALIVHGNQDPVVPVKQSATFAESHKNVRFVRLDTGHELTDVLPAVWEESRNFLFDESNRVE